MAGLSTIIDRNLLLREVDAFPSGVSNDGVEGFTVESKNFVRISRSSSFNIIEVGVFADGTTDMTSRLQAVLNHSKVKTIVFDKEGGGDVLISGTVTVPAGKVIKFASGTRITGTGTLVNPVFEDLHSDSISTSITLTNPKTVSSVTSLPLNPSKGMFLFDTADGTYKYWNGTEWVMVEAHINTYIEEGTNVTVTGDGSFGNPFVISSTGSAAPPSIRTITGSGNFTSSDFTLLVNSSSGPITVTIDALSAGKLGFIKKISGDSNTVTVIATGAQIEGQANYVLNGLNEVLHFQRDATNYYILNK